VLGKGKKGCKKGEGSSVSRHEKERKMSQAIFLGKKSPKNAKLKKVAEAKTQRKKKTTTEGSARGKRR